ncbi:F-box only protein 33 [Myotis brandtii]|uniref:F-box only protein 33 n=1 Tax=Myotis brandtii TaxID=109478 RepID=S7PYZ5_MYOBR|nr:F-box only protein 33 [Myotis brandtii]
MVEQLSGWRQAKAGASRGPIAPPITPQMVTSSGNGGPPSSQELREPGGEPGPDRSSRRQDGGAGEQGCSKITFQALKPQPHQNNPQLLHEVIFLSDFTAHGNQLTASQTVMKGLGKSLLIGIGSPSPYTSGLRLSRVRHRKAQYSMVVACVGRIGRCLQRVSMNLQKFSLFGDISVPLQQGNLSSTYLSKVDPDGKKIKQIQQLFEEILSNSRQLKWLSCGFMLEIVTPTSLSSLSNSIANTMEHLSLLDNNIPGNSTLITTVELERFVNLRSLALDFCDFTAEMARVLSDSNHVPLQRLSLLVHNVSVMHKSLDNMPNDEHWKALSRRSPSLRVYIMAFDIKSEDMLKILKPSIPLERIHFDSYITCVSGAIVDLISRQYDKFLTHFILMNDVIDTSGFPDLSDNRNEDPLVLLAWRCTKLSLLAIHGYTVWAHNLIAIARLRGSNLKVLEVTEESIDFDQGELADQDVDPVHNLIEQVSLGLGQPWHAVMDIESLSVFTEPNRHFYREMQSFSEDI